MISDAAMMFESLYRLASKNAEGELFVLFLMKQAMEAPRLHTSRREK